ncbi:putative nicotinate-nucleotide pyrophosphorylase [carboxylating] [bacterium HR23]|uniref:Probable nicotinate-nucleotide pyrophosphorylase [carboxylating] n=1 Tax=uncultured prokaryote TaxID=198431 RepID=H5SLE9_9ZZZZ|nr:nicotinate-nucleotide diphosphorylase (carboxylating) [uncultured prokaryote]GBD11014.1 putative nicotinate-nucleotide pyrophosphorylase [carboxylating] [bacterium HR23]
MWPLNLPEVQDLIRRAVQEDLCLGDPTTDCLVPPDLRGEGIIFAKKEGVLCGVEVALAVFRQIDPQVQGAIRAWDGERLRPGQKILEVRGAVASLLKGERTALNFLQHLSGIATGTAQLVEAVRGTRAVIVDTRKTIPGLRLLEKYAVRIGGGRNHRMNLGDGILIKDNHLAVLRSQGLTVRDAVQRARRYAPHTLRVEVEVTTLEEVQEALEAGADLILLDNMSLEEMRQAVRLVNGRALLEASGGITLETVRAVAETGVDIISSGALTHSAKALDISMDIAVAPGPTPH